MCNSSKKLFSSDLEPQPKIFLKSSSYFGAIRPNVIPLSVSLGIIIIYCSDKHKKQLPSPEVYIGMMMELLQYVTAASSENNAHDLANRNPILSAASVATVSVL